MKCPGCQAEYTELKSVALKKDSINQFGRREIIFKAKHENSVEWKDGKFHCKRCGLTFSFNEGVFQRVPEKLGD